MFRMVALTSAFVLAGLAPDAMAQVKLEHKFIEGSKTKSLVTTKSHQILTINGADQETNSEQFVTTTSTVGNRKSDGTLSIEQKIDSIRLQLSLPMNKVFSYDSASPPAKIDDDPVASMLINVCEVLVGSTYSISLDKQNHFVSVEGFQQVLDKANAQGPSVVDLIKERLDVDRIKKAFEDEQLDLPPILVREGDTWERTQETFIGGGQTLTFKKKYEYMGTADQNGRTLDKVKVTALAVTYALEPKANSAVKIDKSDLKIASSEGMFLFDREAGRAVESSSVNRITGGLTITANGMEFPSQLDLTLDIGSKVQK
jgi:Family of unknown function (DUF6263)